MPLNTHVAPEDDYRDERGQRTIRMNGNDVTYRGYTIVEKRDFGKDGFLIRGFRVKHGYVVTNGVANIMPAAAWFLTVDEALRAVDDFEAAKLSGNVTSKHPMWAFSRFRRCAEENAPELALLLQQMVEAAKRVSDAAPLPVALMAHAEALLDQIDSSCDMRPRVVNFDQQVSRIGVRHTGRFGVGAPPPEPSAIPE